MVFNWQRKSDDPAIAARTPPGQVLTEKLNGYSDSADPWREERYSDP